MINQTTVLVITYVTARSSPATPHTVLYTWILTFIQVFPGISYTNEHVMNRNDYGNKSVLCYGFKHYHLVGHANE